MTCGIGYFIHCLLVPREYKVIGGRLHVREGFGEFEDIEDHLKNEHPEAYDAVVESMRKEGK